MTDNAARKVVQLYAESKSQEAVAAEIGITQQAVSQVLRRRGVDPAAERAAVRAKETSQLVELLANHPAATPQALAGLLSAQFGTVLSPRTVERRLTALGIPVAASARDDYHIDAVLGRCPVCERWIAGPLRAALITCKRDGESFPMTTVRLRSRSPGY